MTRFVNIWQQNYPHLFSTCPLLIFTATLWGSKQVRVQSISGFATDYNTQKIKTLSQETYKTVINSTFLLHILKRLRILKCLITHLYGAFLIAQLVKNLPVMQETLVQFLDWEVPLEKGQATHSRILGLPLWLSW